MQYFLEKMNGERLALAHTKETPLEPAEQCNRLLMSGKFERVIATPMLTVLRLKGARTKAKAEARLFYGGRKRGETKGHGDWVGA